jgi:uncharacterized delta-60 repeat protein
MSGGRTTAIRAGADELVRLLAKGSGCRLSSLDSQPAIAGGIVEFTLVFSAGCFATPPGFLWTGDIGPLPVGTYTVNYYLQYGSSPGAPMSAKTLIGTRTLIVGPRPDAYAPATPGTPDRSFGTDGVLHMPYPGFFNPRVGMAMQSNGRVVVSAPSSPSIAVSRLVDVGASDATFAVDGTVTYPDSFFFGRAMAIGVNDEILIAGAKAQPYEYGRFTIHRYSPAGAFTSEIIPDPSAISGNPFFPAYNANNSSATEIMAQQDGRFVAAGVGSVPGTPYSSAQWFVLRFGANGTVDLTFGQAGIFVGPFPGSVYRIVPASDGGLWLLGTNSDATPATFIFKLTAAGQPDASFGQDGVVFGAFSRSAPKEQQDGKILVGGDDFSLLRFERNGAPDLTFGDRGLLRNPTGLPLMLQDFLLQEDGKFLLVGALYVNENRPAGFTDVAYRPVLARYNPDGSLDASFGQNGVATVNVLTHTSGYIPSESMSLLRLPNGKGLLVLPGAANWYGNDELLVYRFRTEDDSSIQPVTEFYHAGLDHYFITAISTEIAALDNGMFGDWSRTGETFNAYANAPPDSTSVCRFFSAAFAPKSSHFYTPDAAECAFVKQSPSWLFEGEVFNIPVPDQQGSCATGTQPVYRLYNNGQGGAPNHRYTISLATRTMMIADGWIPEGYGPVGVIMCAPCAGQTGRV